MVANQFLTKSVRWRCIYHGVKSFIEINLSHTVSVINAFLRFTQKFDMATMNDW